MAVADKGSTDYLDLNLYEDDVPIITNPAHLFLQEIELSVKIGASQIWGVADYINLQRYLFSQYVTINRIQSDIRSYITKYCTHATQFDWDLSVEFFKDPDSQKEMLVVTLSVHDILENGEVQDYVSKFAIV